MQSLNVPAKIIMIGEYSVIDGGLAILAALKPPFVYAPLAGAAPFHPGSPAGRYANAFGKALPLQLQSQGLGSGFGTSSAELISSAWVRTGTLPATRELWSWFRSEYPEASGADVATQLEAMHTGHSIFEVKNFEMIKIASSAVTQQILVFRSQARDKLKTHEDLARIRQAVPRALSDSLVSRVRDAFTSGIAEGLTAFNDFADCLSGLDLETKRAFEMRKRLRALPEVLSVKGCGAGLNDVFLVVLKSNSSSHERVLEIAEEMGLEGLGMLGDLLW